MRFIVLFYGTEYAHPHYRRCSITGYRHFIHTIIHVGII